MAAIPLKDEEEVEEEEEEEEEDTIPTEEITESLAQPEA
jgi:hypothetical protein